MPPKISDRLFNPVSEAKEATSVGLSICWQECPVRAECLAWMRANEKQKTPHGIAGGYTSAERKAMVRAEQREKRLAKQAAAVEEAA